MKSFESLIDKLEIYGFKTNVLRDFNYNAGGTPHESHPKHVLNICNLYQYHPVILLILLV